MSDASTRTGSNSNEISRAMVMLTKARTGKGPTRARTYISDDLIVCLLREGMTQVEKTLVHDDHEGTVGEVRHLLQSSFEDEAIATVERLMKRKVVSFMSTHDLHNDVAAELFVLEPLPSEDAGRLRTDAAPARRRFQEARSHLKGGPDEPPLAT
jgi:uncharacterized protein YbcI